MWYIISREFKKGNKMKLTKNEIDFISKTAEIELWSSYNVVRKSEREFDLNIEGTKEGFGFVGWFPLVVIRLSNWVDLAKFSDYPIMVANGDWSGIRDSSIENIWRMFEIVK